MKPKELKKIIDNTLDIDISRDVRFPEYVFARAIYYKLLRDKGFSLVYIGDTLGKNHATVIYALKNFEIYKTFDDFKQIYERVMLAVNKEFRNPIITKLNNSIYEIRRYTKDATI